MVLFKLQSAPRISEAIIYKPWLRHGRCQGNHMSLVGCGCPLPYYELGKYTEAEKLEIKVLDTRNRILGVEQTQSKPWEI